jgi:hypothetical protein
VTDRPGLRAPIKAVIFDIGGILERPFDDVLFPELSRMLGVPESRLRQRRAADAVALTEGRMTLREFYERLAGEGRPAVDADAAVARHLAVYAAVTVPLDARVLGLVEELRRRCLVACLTNTEVSASEPSPRFGARRARRSSPTTARRTWPGPRRRACTRSTTRTSRASRASSRACSRGEAERWRPGTSGPRSGAARTRGS